jgi:hypothetical protein
MINRMDRSYQAEYARSRPLPEAKLPWASPVVGWVTTCEPDVTICLLHFAFSIAAELRAAGVGKGARIEKPGVVLQL